MSALKQVMQVIGSHHISNQLLESDCNKSGGLISNGEYAWFAAGADIILYSKQLGSVVSSRSFATNQKDKSLTITFVQELHKSENPHILLVGCSCKSFGILFVCQLPTLTTIRCIHMPNPISYISTINNESLAQDQLCDEFKVMSTVLLVGMITGAVFAVDLRQRHIENQLRRNEIVVNESRPSKLFVIRKNEDCQEVKEMSDDSDCHLAMFINENFCIYCKKQYRGKLSFSISSLLYNEEINTVAIGYSTGHFQLWDCKMMRTIYLLKEPKCVMPVTHITFLEPSDDPNNLCYLWVIQSDNSRLPNAMMIALTYEQRTVMSNGCLSYRVYKGNGIKLEMSLRRESGIGRCISALTLCNVNLFRNETDMDEDCEIRLFAMLMEIRQNVDASPESYVFLFDINQWYKAQMPSNINHLKVSNSYASFVKLPHNASYLDLNISDQTLRPFGYNFRNNVEELYYPSSIYFECDCLLDTEIIRFKHAGVQQEILDQLLLKNWRLLINPSLIFSQCLQTNLRPFFWDKTDDYANYSLPDQRSFVISIIVENKIMSVLSACAEEWKNGTYVSSEATILHLVQCLWKHVMVVKQYADKLCVPLFDYSGTQLGKKNERILNHCVSQMLCVKHFLEDLHNAYGIHIINVDYSYRVYTLNLVTQYFKAVTCFLNYGLLPESNEEDPTQKIIQCDFSSLIQYAIKRRLEFGGLSLYLIDAFVSNEPKGNKLIEQWQHEGGEETKGLYPPSNVQCLLRIYLNAALSNQVKDFITIYFLIDVCSSREIDVITANRMCNFAIEFDIENKGLNALCRASWLLDHDMFGEAMEILASSNEWMVNDKSWDWYHWTVLKLLVFKEQYFWARFYMQLTKISLVNIDDHKFYVNLQIMNNQCFDTLIYLRARPFKEQQTLFEYFFDRCRETNRLKCLIEYLWDAEEAELFLSYLKKFDDTETLTFQLLFLLQRGRHKEAIKLNQTLKANLKSNNNDALTITSLLVDGFEKSIPNIMKNNYGRLPLQSVYKKPNVVVKCMNNESKMFVMDRNKTNNLVKRKSASFTPSNSIDLFLPSNNNMRKRSPLVESPSPSDMICNEKRRKIDDNLLSTPIADNEIVKPIEKQVLEILNTPLVEKTIASPSITSYSSILKTKLATNKHKLSFSNDKTPRSSIRFSLPCNADTTPERVDPEDVVNVQHTDNPENESFYSVDSSDANDLPNQISEEKPLTSQESLEDSSKLNKSDEYEKMDISEDNSCSGNEQIEIDDMSKNETKEENMISIPSDEDCIMLTSDDEDEDVELIEVSKLSPKNTSLSLKEDNTQLLTPKSYPIDMKKNLNPHYATLIPLDTNNYTPIPNVQEDISKTEKPLINKVSIDCRLDTNSNDRLPVKKMNDDIELILLDSDEDESDVLSAGSSDGGSIEESDGSIESEGSIMSEDSDLENTRYGRFKSQERQGGEDSNDEELGEYIEEEDDDDDDDDIGEDEIEEEIGECEIEEDEIGDSEIEEDCEEEVEELDISEQYEGDSEESEIEVTPKQSENIWRREDENDLDLHSEGSEESNLEQPCMASLEQQNVKFDENDKKKNLETCRSTYIGSGNKDKKYDNDEDNSELVIYNNLEDQADLKCVENKEEYHAESFADKSYDENEDNLEDPDDVSDENLSEESDIIIDDESDDNTSEEPVVVLDSENEDNLEVQNAMLDDANEEPNSILVGDNDDNLEVPNVIINDDTSGKNSDEEIHSILDDESEVSSSEEPGVLLVVGNEENSSDEPGVLLNVGSEEKSSEEPSVLLDVASEENNSEVLDDAIEQNSSEVANVILYDESAANNLILLTTLKNEKLSEKNELVDNDKIVYPIDSQSSSLENLTPILYDVSEESHSNENNQICDEENENAHSIIIEDDNTNDLCVKKDNDNVIEVVENTDKVSEPINLDDIEHNKDDVCIDQNEEYMSLNNDNSFEMSRSESNPIPDDGFNHLTMTGVEADQLEMDVNESSPFMFGESFFGQQEIPEKKPMLLFGHLYSFENEQLDNVDVQANKLETQESVAVENEVDITNKETEVEIQGEIQDILELESLPESNPDDNFETQNNADSNNLQPQLKEFNETLNDNGQTMLSDSHLQKPIYFGNIDSVEVFEKKEQTPCTSIDLSKKSLELEKKDLSSYECCDLLTIKQTNPSSPNESEGQIYKTDKILSNTVDTHSVNTMESDVSSCVIVDEKTSPISQGSITTEPIDIINKQDADEVHSQCDNDQLIENQNINTSSNNEEIESHQLVELNKQDAEEVHSNCATSIVSCSSNIDQFNDFSDNDNLLKKQNINENINTTLNNEEIESHQLITSVQKLIELDTTTVKTVDLQFPDASGSIQKVANENKTNLVENLAELDKSHKKSTLDIPQIENYSLRSSSRKSISKTKDCLLGVPSTTEQILTRNKKKLLSDPIQENKTSMSFEIDEIKKAKSIPPVDTNTITTRSRAKSEPKQVQLETISSNIFRSSGMVEDNSRQVRVSLSRKRSKSQENIPLIKRRSGRSKSLAPIEESEVTNRKTVFGLEKIPEEETSNLDSNIIKTEHTTLKRKSKFNFLSNSSKKIEHDNISLKCQQDIKIRTPRRSKSLQPDPVLTFSVVKTKPKRSSSVNILISDDETSTDKDDLMGVLKKALNSSEKMRKRSVSESLKSRKKQKIQNHVEEEKKVVAESKYNSNAFNQSNQNSNSSYSSEQLSPIAGNISQHMLYTPAKKRTKIRMVNMDSENEGSSSDESTDSHRIMTRSMIQNSSIVELDPIHSAKSEIKPSVKSKVPINRSRRSSVSSIPEMRTTRKSASSVFEKDEALLPKRKTKNIKETIVHAPIEPLIEAPSTSERRMTRFQQSILDKSLQSTSVIG
ncbi:protein ELYS-like isoform X2 [Myzus persicae]|nr:protein ELYS-like isoform X2 [Myzus persicae]